MNPSKPIGRNAKAEIVDGALVVSFEPTAEFDRMMTANTNEGAMADELEEPVPVTWEQERAAIVALLRAEVDRCAKRRDECRRKGNRREAVAYEVRREFAAGFATRVRNGEQHAEALARMMSRTD